MNRRSNLDHAYAEDIMDLFGSFNQVGVTIMLSTRDEGFLKQRPIVSRLEPLGQWRFAPACSIALRNAIGNLSHAAVPAC